MLKLKMKRKGEDGFTLIELIVTITIMGILIVGIVNLYITIETSQRKSYHLEVANRAGERQIEVLRNAQFGSLTPGEDIDFTTSLPNDLPEPRSGIVEVSEPESGLRRVDVTITYKDGGGSRTIRQSSLIGIIGISQ